MPLFTNLKPGEMQLSIVIVNYKTPGLLLDCLASIYRETSGIFFEIIVVDNHSQDNSERIVKEKFSDVTWLALPENLGFAGGNNEGIKIAKGRYILLLNSDTVVLDRALNKCVDYLSSCADPTIKALGCRLINKEGNVQFSSFPKEIWPSLKKVFFRNIIVGKIKSMVFVNDYKPFDSKTLHQKTHLTDAVAGAFILFDREIISTAGLLDPDFFLYFEEIEWANRITKTGYKIVYYSDACIIHLGEGSSIRVPVKSQTVLSQSLFMLKVHGKLTYLLYITMHYANIVTGWLLYPFLSPKVKSSFNRWLKLFLPFRSGHLKILFRYRQQFASGKSPLKDASSREKR